MYRGALVSIPDDLGFISVWSASLLKNGDPDRIAREVAIEKSRTAFYPHRVSRLRGMYCFMDMASAQRALVKNPGVQMRFGFITSFVMAILAIVGVFIEIPIVSQYAFWFVVGAYIVLAGSRW